MSNKKNKKDLTPVERLDKAKSRLFDKSLGFIKTNLIIILIDVFLLRSGLKIPMFVFLGTSIGMISNVFNYISLRTKLLREIHGQPVSYEKEAPQEQEVSYYAALDRELGRLKMQISALLEKCGENIKNHKTRILKDIDIINKSIEVLVKKGKSIQEILRQFNIDDIEKKRVEFLEKYMSVKNESLKNDIQNHIKLLEDQKKKYNKLLEAEEIIKVKIESTKSSMTSLIMDLTRIDANPDMTIETELDAAIDNIELKTIELDALSDLLDKQEL